MCKKKKKIKVQSVKRSASPEIEINETQAEMPSIYPRPYGIADNLSDRDWDDWSDPVQGQDRETGRS